MTQYIVLCFLRSKTIDIELEITWAGRLHDADPLVKDYFGSLNLCH